MKQQRLLSNGMFIIDLWKYCYGINSITFSMKQMVTRDNDPDSFLRRLIYFPIVHTEVDMGALSESVRRATCNELGEKSWKRKVNLINKMWTEIELVIDGLDLPYAKVRLYQDGLPVCGKEVEIVKELTTAGSRNHRLLLRLMGRGATIMGTESSTLLVREYELIKQMRDSANTLNPGRPSRRLPARARPDSPIGGRASQRQAGRQPSGEAGGINAHQKSLSESLLRERDQYIADRIDSTLGIGETGVLFLGMLHSLEALLSGNIEVIYPINRPLTAGGKVYERKRQSHSDRGR